MKMSTTAVSEPRNPGEMNAGVIRTQMKTTQLKAEP